MNMKKSLFRVALALLSSPCVVSAATVNFLVPEFVGTTESFSSFSVPAVPGRALQGSASIFGGSATMTGVGTPFTDAEDSFFVVTAGNWVLDGSQVTPTSVSKFAAIAGIGYVEIQFTQGGVSQFGGYFADLLSGSTTIDLFGLDNTLLGSTTILSSNVSTNGNLLWAGLTSDTLIRRIRISGNQTAMDDLVFRTDAPAPVPLPAAAWLLLSGLAGLGFFSRRRATA